MNNNKKKFHYDEDWIDVFSEYIDSNAVESDFDGFWQDVQEYANQLGVGTRYVEEVKEYYPEILENE